MTLRDASQKRFKAICWRVMIRRTLFIPVSYTHLNLVTVMTRHLQSSESVTLDGLGTFRLTMKSTMNGVEDPLKVSATQSTLRVRFLPTSKRNLDHTVSTRSLVTGVKCVRFDLQDTAGSGGNDGGSGGNDGDQGENPLG